MILRFPFRRATDRIRGGLAVTAVGYDDKRRIRSDKGALLVRNSWGSDWGEQGYGWLPYAYIRERLATDIWTIAEAVLAQVGRVRTAAIATPRLKTQRVDRRRWSRRGVGPTRSGLRQLPPNRRHSAPALSVDRAFWRTHNAAISSPPAPFWQVRTGKPSSATDQEHAEVRLATFDHLKWR